MQCTFHKCAKNSVKTPKMCKKYWHLATKNLYDAPRCRKPEMRPLCSPEIEKCIESSRQKKDRKCYFWVSLLEGCVIYNYRVLKSRNLSWGWVNDKIFYRGLLLNEIVTPMQSWMTLKNNLFENISCCAEGSVRTTKFSIERRSERWARAQISAHFCAQNGAIFSILRQIKNTWITRI